MDETIVELKDSPPLDLDIPEELLAQEPIDFIPYSAPSEEIAAKPKRKGRPPGSKNKQVELVTEEPVSFDFILLLNGLNNIVESILGVDARITDVEMSLITTGLAGIVKNTPKGVVERASNLINVIFLAIGLLLWGSRIALEFAKQRKEQAQQKQINKPLGASEVKVSPSTLETPIPNGVVKTAPPGSDVQPSFLFNNSIT